MSFLASLIGGAWAKLALYAAVAVLVAGILLGARRSGRDAERVKQKEQALESLKRQRKAAARAPADLDGLIGGMRDGRFF